MTSTRRRNTRSWLVGVVVLLVAIAAGVFVLSDRGEQRRAAHDEAVSPSSAFRNQMAGDTSGYAIATGPRPFVFPDDHGPHPDYKLEWWYYTGNVEASGGERFGYQFTIFRTALAPPTISDGDGAADETKGRADAADLWSTRQLYFAHLAVTDVAGEEFYSFERFSRGAAGLAGGVAEPFRVWIEDWAAEASDATGAMPASRGPFPMLLSAREGDVGIELELAPAKPRVLQGDRGFSRKGVGTGQASYYYSYTRLGTTGRVITPRGSFDVSGQSWMDREWSTSILSEDQVGWDWFSLQLDDDRELMYFQLRREDGSASYSDGLIVEPDGSTREYDGSGVELTVLDTWESVETGVTYPSGWRLETPDGAVALTIAPVVRDQELDVSVTYWEGAVDVRGTLDGREATGVGYAELTGYGGMGSPR